ncbi:MAG TPA: ATPase domain-containing protein [Frateuria sp.]|uniref:ATPase domain-containing protein n=1 Tax=Frateuria sp. TaxID=2211372 RepID=UPI002D804B7B|nr:ATPase domain-containing protein [Frateuria sp.]HET6803920.1 ATPase domain-containing protein [Frateuria sp.]
MSTADPTLQRISTGVPGLDQILDGGLFGGAVYIVRGSPGAGKTILANQVCFHHVGHGGRALFVTLLAESHARMLQHMAGMSFYNAEAIPGSLYYVSAFRTLEDEGLKGLMDLLRREIRSHRASLLVLDGLLAVEETSASDREFRKFIHELQAHAALADCTVLLLTNGSRSEYHPEHTMVDGLITLDDVAYGKRRQRELEIKKFRGSASLRGRHPFRIGTAGIVLFPRVEAFLPSATARAPAARVSTGVPDLDAMMAGGPLRATSTLLLGASGAGKTTLGTSFLSCCSAEEPGLHFGFFETPERLVANAAAIGVELQQSIDAGHLHIVWRPPTEQILDDLGNALLDAVRRHGVKRLFIDSLGGFISAADARDRLPAFFAALTDELRVLGVTTLLAVETPNLVSPEVHMPIAGVSALAENMVLLRFAEYGARLYRLISVLKVRGGGFDPRLREFEISAAGVKLQAGFKGAEDMLFGYGRPAPEAPQDDRSATARHDVLPPERG